MATPAGYTQLITGWYTRNVDNSGPYSIDAAGNVTLMGGLSPSIFKVVNNIVVTAETPIWTPAAGKKFRLMGVMLTGGVVAGNVVLKDNTAGATIFLLPFGAAGATVVTALGNGILSASPNNLLTATGAATQTVSGMVWGTEE